MVMRTITLTVDQPKFFDEVSKYGLINSSCPIGSRVIACLLGGVDWREAMGLGVYGVQVFEDHSAGQPSEASTAALATDEHPSSPSPVEGGGWRPEVRAFADLMEAQLRANDHKPGWKSDPVWPLIERLHEECSELHREVDVGDEPGTPAWISRVGNEAADVANFAMMIADVCGALPAPTSPPQATNSEVERLTKAAKVLRDVVPYAMKALMETGSRDNLLLAVRLHRADADVRAALDQGVE